ncbi:MAG: hypothetical protein KJ053_13115 [Dehalococcoidia bacterium]|nr:hypothetical protein [Dehalococcoidia bacterium]
MTCNHPREEWQRVYEGGATPVPGRFFCSSCGEHLYSESPPHAAGPRAQAVPLPAAGRGARTPGQSQ